MPPLSNHPDSPPFQNSSQPDSALLTDAAFQELNTSFQKGNWKKSTELIHKLLAKYPDHPLLKEYQDDIAMQARLHKIERGKVWGQAGNIILVVLLVGALAVGLVYLGYTINQQYQQNAQLAQVQNEQKLAQMQVEYIRQLEDQARAALQAGKPEDTLEILKTIEAQDPQNPVIGELRGKVNELTALIDQYNQAMKELAANNLDKALEAFLKIQQKDPTFRDVSYQIGLIQKQQKVLQLVKDAETAYQAKKWEDTLRIYTEALSIDSSVNSEIVKERMLYSYLNLIIDTLSKKEPTIEELERSIVHYRKAISLIPQDRKRIAEREELQNLSFELLVTKNFQMGKNLLKDPTQNDYTVSKAVLFLRTAAELRPEDLDYVKEVEKAVLYQAAFASFNASKWDAAIRGFTNLAKFDQSYPNDMGRTLLFESYAGRGRQLYAGGFYLDARSNFEKGEFIAWEQPENKLNLFWVQMQLGYTLGKVNNYRDALSYFRFALNAIKYPTKLKPDDPILNELLNGNNLFLQSKFADSYTVYSKALTNLEKFYNFQQVSVKPGDNLVYVAKKYASNLQVIRQFNQVDFPNVTQNQVLNIPYIP
jgi:tetratricopeptide (TPR) repeat protein